MIHSQCLSDDCDCLDAESWFSGVSLKNLLVEDRPDLSLTLRELRDKANHALKSVIRRHNVLPKTGMDHLQSVIVREIGIHGPSADICELFRSLWSQEHDEFRHYYFVKGIESQRDLIVKLVVRELKATTRYKSNQLDFSATGPVHDCPLCSDQPIVQSRSWWP